MLKKLFVFDSLKTTVRTEILCLAIMMPLTYSISNGILLGMITYVLINMICGNFRKITPVMYILAVLFILKFI